MTPGSLRLRLVAAASLAILLVLGISGAVLSRLFTAHVEAHVDAELLNHLNQLLANLEIDPEGSIALTTLPADPRFDRPNGGLYWQIQLPNGGQQRSRSLWESVLTLPDDVLPDGSVHRHAAVGPASSRLIALERGVKVGPESKPLALRVAVAIDRHEIDDASRDFRAVLARSLTVLGLGLLAALWVQVHVGLRPLAMLRAALQKVHTGARDRIEGEFPAEVGPLVEDLNALLARERRRIEQAREQAGDLAHGFKTPLSVLAAVSRDLKREKRPEAAREIDVQIDMMGRHVSAALARTRIAGAVTLGRMSTPVAPVVNRVVDALRRIAADRNLIWSVEIPVDVVFPGDESDLLEVVGNIADNAAKWARSKVTIRATEREGAIHIRFDDDGPGLPPGSQAAVPARGRRIDESRDGTGLGLSIVAKIVEAYAGSMTLDASSMGGLAVTIAVPVPGGTLRRAQSSK